MALDFRQYGPVTRMERQRPRLREERARAADDRRPQGIKPLARPDRDGKSIMLPG